MLRTAFQRGRDGALARFHVKVARGTVQMSMPPPMHPALMQLHSDLHTAPAALAAPTPASAPAARPAVSFDDMHRGIAQQLAANVNPHPAPLPAARAFVGHGAAAAGGGTGGGTPAPSSGSGGGGGGVGRFMRPIGKGLGYGALAAAGLGAYGLHEANKRDEEGRNLAYAPMSGGNY